MPYPVCIRIPTKTLFALTLSILTSFVSTASAQAATPHISYSDLISGPNTGGESNFGAYVTVYGKNFGATQGSSTVTVGGGAAVKYPIWTDTKVTFQLGATAGTGNIQVNTSAGASNGVPFTVRAGNIYFVSTSGNDANTGAFASPWNTLLKARNTMQSGDTVYAMNGVSQSSDDGEGWNADFTLRAEWCSASGPPRAIVAYPGATATIGNASESNQAMSGLRTTDFSATNGACLGNYVFAGLNFRGTNPAGISGGTNWRFAGNDITCPAAMGNGGGACFESSQASNIAFLGNNVHDAGAANASALFQGVYFSTDSNHVEMAYNTVSNVKGCRGVQIHSSPILGGGPSDPTGYNMYDINIHDNVIHDIQCDGIVIATIDPSKGAVQVWNNVIYNAGKGPNNPEGSGNWSCVYIPGTTNDGPAGTGTVDIYNNTMYNCGSFASPPWGDANNAVENGGGNQNIRIRMRNNLIFQTSSAPYLTIYGPSQTCPDGQNCPQIYGSNNLFFGNGPAPVNPNITGSLNVDPKLLNVGAFDFHLAAGSPAGTAGTATGQLYDLDGIALGSAIPIGAYTLGTGTGITPPSINLSPNSISLTGGGTQQFTATVTGASGATVNWSMNPSMGTLLNGIYTAPASIAATQTVTITASLAGNASVTATASVTLNPPTAPTISLTPTTVTVNAGQTQQFKATPSNGGAVSWSLSPTVGTMSATGLYTAPATMSSSQKITAKATLTANTNVSASATVTVNPPATAAVTLTPSSSSLSASQTQQFTATVTNSASTAVTWSLSGTGTLSAAGFYTAPASIPAQTTATVTAKLTSDPTKTTSASITLNPVGTGGGGNGYTVTLTPIGTSSLQVMWTAPANRPFNDWISLTSPGAPTWWNLWEQNTNGTTGGSVIVPMPAGPAQFDFAYFTAGSYNQVAVSKSFAVNTVGFNLSETPAKPVHGTTVTVNWVAPSGRPSDDWIALYKLGAQGDKYLWYANTNGATSGTATFKAPATAGSYELRYMDNGYANVQSVPLTVQ